MDKNKDRSLDNIFDGLTVVVTGLVLLLNTTGNLPWSFWIKLFAFWPIFLIGFGIEIVCQFNKPLKIFGKIINFILLLVIAFLAAVAVDAKILRNVFIPSSIKDLVKDNKNFGELLTQKDEVKVSEPIDKLNAKIEIAQGRVNVDFKNMDKVFESNSYFYENYGKPKFTKNVSNQALNVTLNTETKFDVKNILSFPNNLKYDITFDNELNKARYINIDLGAGDINFNLDEYRYVKSIDNSLISDIKISTEQKFNLKVGAGNINIQLGKNIGYKVESKVGLGELKINDKKFDDEKTYISDNYDSSYEKVIFILDTGVGDIKIFNN